MGFILSTGFSNVELHMSFSFNLTRSLYHLVHEMLWFSDNIMSYKVFKIKHFNIWTPFKARLEEMSKHFG